jgi:diacylglycerol kinase family enzyme
VGNLQPGAAPRPYLSMSYYVIFNSQSGTALSSGLTEQLLAEKFRQHDIDAVIDARDDELEQKIQRACASDANIVVSAGGDGTATAIARGLGSSNKPFAIIPLGTANLLARDLGIPLSLDDAIASLKGMEITSIDAGEVNGELFLHKVVVGVVPAIAAAREKSRGGGLMQLLAFARYLIMRLHNARKITISITSRDTENRTERIHAVAIANNAYDEGWGKLFARSCLTAGSLNVYVLRRLALGDAIRLAVKMVTGTWQEDEMISIETVRSLTLSTKHKRVPAMVDGEVEILETPLRFRIKPRAVSIVAPRPSPKETSEKRDEPDAHCASVRPAFRPS